MKAGKIFRYAPSVHVLWIVFVGVIVSFWLNNNRLSQEQMELQKDRESFDVAYRSVISMFALATDEVVELVVHTPRILELISQGVHTTGKEQDRARGQLYRELFNAYESLSKQNLRQLQFHLPSGYSFLRFERPERYGDNLLDARPSIRLANQRQQPVSGFEAGRVYSGYRFVYPIKDKEHFLGTVETSVSIKAILESLHALDASREYAFIINKEIIERIVFPEQRSFYTPSILHQGFVVEDAKGELPNSPRPLSMEAQRINLILANNEPLKKALSLGEHFSTFVLSEGRYYSVGLEPIKGVEGRVEGYIVSYQADETPHILWQDFKGVLAVIFFLNVGIIVLLFWLHYRSLQNQSQKEELETIMNTLAEGVYVIDTKGCIVEVNATALEVLGYERKEMIGKEASLLFHPYTQENSLSEDETSFYHAMRLGKPFYSENEVFTCKDGRMIPVGIRSKPLWREGREHLYVSAFFDITEAKKVQDDLRHAKEVAEAATCAKSQFLANMSHELRTPLNAIMGMGTLLSDTPLNKEQSNLLSKLNHASELLNHLVSDILDYSKIESGEVPLEIVEVNVDGMLEQMEALFSETAAQKGITLAFCADTDVPSLIAVDLLRLTQILNNLLSNALKFTHKGQVGLLIRLKNRRDTKHATLLFEVSDTGIGMQHDQIEGLFQPFMQADNSTTRQFGGTGLGLSIVRRLAHLMGGEISVQSVEGRGSLFTLILPVGVIQWDRVLSKTTDAEKRLEDKPVEVSCATTITPELPTVLIVDDTPSNIHTLSTILKAEYRIKVAKDGVSALKIASVQGAIDLILLDIVMPDMDGYAVCEVLKKDPYMQHIPVIFVTAKDAPDEQAYGFELGAADYITKPFDPTVVKVRVKHQIELKSTQEELERLSLYDGLTQIPNRRYFDAFYEKTFKESLREKVSMAILMMDIDYFKRYNDHYGHAAGDTCLVEVARALKEAVYRPSDLLARYGGEEFVVVLKDVSIEGATKVAQRLLEAVEALHLPHEHSSCSSYVTLSIGVALKAFDVELSQKELLMKADEALYEAKAQGRNRVVWHMYEGGAAEHGDL